MVAGRPRLFSGLQHKLFCRQAELLLLTRTVSPDPRSIMKYFYVLLVIGIAATAMSAFALGEFSTPVRLITIIRTSCMPHHSAPERHITTSRVQIAGTGSKNEPKGGCGCCSAFDARCMTFTHRHVTVTAAV